MPVEVVIDSTLDTGVTADVTIYQDLNGDGVFENADTVTATGGTETFTLAGLANDSGLTGTYESSVEYSDDNDITTGGEITSITVQEQVANILAWDSKADIVEPESRLAIPTSGVGARSQDQLAHKYELGTTEEGLVAYYPFDGDVNDAALDNDGTDNTSAGYVTGQVGTQAKDFDGVDDYVNTGILLDTNPSTISFWFKPDNTTDDASNEAFATSRNNISNFFTIERFGSKANWGWEVGGTDYRITAPDYNTDWQHICITWSDITGNTSLYYNGELFATSTGLNTLSLNNELPIGARNNGGTIDLFSDVTIDDFRYYNRVLSGPEVRELVYQQSPDNLIAYYPFDEGSGTTATDESIFGNDRPITGATYAGSGQVGSDALSFDGTDDLVDTGIVVSPEADDQYSISAWFKAPAGSNRRAIAALSESGGEIFRLEVNQPTSGDVEFGVRTASGANATAINTANILDDTWHHAAAIFDGENDTIQLYIDGNLEDSTSFTDAIVTDRSLYVGADNNAGGTQLYFDGEIDDFRLYNTALTSSQVSDLASRTTTETIPALESGNITNRDTLESGLVGHWPLDEKAGNVIDHSTLENDGTPNSVVRPTSGKGGAGASQFNGSSSYVDLGIQAQDILDGNGEFTVCAWINRFSTGTVQSILTNDSGTSPMFRFVVDGNNQLNWRGGNGSTADYRRVLDGWHHVAVVRESDDSLYFSIDGELVDTGIDKPNDFAGNGSNLWIGAANRSGGQSFFDGNMSDVRVYSRALTESEINEIISLSRPENRPILESTLVTKGGVARYSFDNEDTSGTTLTDTFGSNDGTLQNSPTTGASGVSARSEAYTLNGTDQYIKVSDDSSLKFSDGPFSVSVWINRSRTSAREVIVAKDQGSADNIFLEFETDDTIRFQFGSSGSSPNLNFNVSIVPDDGWTHIAATVPSGGTGELRGYINGTLVTTNNTSWGVSDNNTDLTVGVADRVQDGSGLSAFYQGSIDELRLYNRELQSFEISELYASPTRAANVGPNDVSDGLVSRWSMDTTDVSSGTIVDSEGDNNGSIQGGVETGHVGVGYGESFRFNGSDGQIQVIDNPSISGLSSITLSIWLNTDSIGSDQTYWTKGSDSSNSNLEEWFMRLEAAGNLLSEFSDGNNRFRITTDQILSTGEWYHIVFLLDGNEVRKYINGQLLGSVDMSSSINDDSGPMLIGAQTDSGSSTQHFNGFLDDARIYNRALNNYEIWQLYNLGRGYYWSED